VEEDQSDYEESVIGEYLKYIERGDSETAQGWIAVSSLPKRSKELLTRFVHRFPTVEFYREDAAFLDAIEREQGVVLPPWLRTIRQTFAYVLPDHPYYDVRARFDRSKHPIFDREDHDQLWYTIGVRGYDNGEIRDTLEEIEGLRLFPIGIMLETGISWLAVNLADPTDQRVYEFNLENLSDNKHNGVPLARSVYPMFDTYAEMIAHIVGLEVMEGRGVNKVTERIVAHK